MDLRNGNITLGEVLQNPRAAAILQHNFPILARKPMMVRMGRRMTLNQILGHARGRVSPQQLQAVLQELREI